MRSIFFQDWDNDSGVGLCYGKLRIKGTHFVEEQNAFFQKMMAFL